MWLLALCSMVSMLDEVSQVFPSVGIKVNKKILHRIIHLVICLFSAMVNLKLETKYGRYLCIVFNCTYKQRCQIGILSVFAGGKQCTRSKRAVISIELTSFRVMHIITLAIPGQITSPAVLILPAECFCRQKLLILLGVAGESFFLFCRLLCI